MIRLELPWPPSVNAMYRAVGGGLKLSSKSREYFEAASWSLLAQRAVPPDPIGHKVSLNIFVHPPDNRIRDLDNLMKIVCDTMVKCKILKDDSVRVVQQEHIYCCPTVTDGLVVVEIHDCSEAGQNGNHTG